MKIIPFYFQANELKTFKQYKASVPSSDYNTDIWQVK